MRVKSKHHMTVFYLQNDSCVHPVPDVSLQVNANVDIVKILQSQTNQPFAATIFEAATFIIRIGTTGHIRGIIGCLLPSIYLSATYSCHRETTSSFECSEF